MFRGADAEADCDGEVGRRFQRSNGGFDARLRRGLQARYARDRNVIEEPARAIEYGWQARSVCRRGREADRADPDLAKRGAEFLIFFWRKIDADDTVDTRIFCGVREPVATPYGHRVGIAH